MTFTEFKEKAKGKTISQLFYSAVNRIFHLEHITYNIMLQNLNTMPIPDDLSVIIEPMEPEDTDNLATDYFATFDHEFKHNALLHQDPLFEGFMCYDKAHKFIGYCWIMYRGSKYEFFQIKNTDAYLAEFYINKDVRGQGLGPAMLISVCKVLKIKGLSQIKLAVRETNKSAIRCYTKAGFQDDVQYNVLRDSKKRKVYPYHSL